MKFATEISAELKQLLSDFEAVPTLPGLERIQAKFAQEIPLGSIELVEWIYRNRVMITQLSAILDQQRRKP